MPEVEYTTTMALPADTIWEFVRDMNNWAPFLTGYQKHEILNETDSLWTLKGDVGILSRLVELKAHVTEWNGPERVAFTLTGLNEDVEGGGTLVIGPRAPGSVVKADALPAAVERKSWFQRLVASVFRFLFELVNKKPVTRAELTAGAPGKDACDLTFTLRMTAGGPTGPLVNAMLGPALLPAAEDLANKIAAHLSRVHAAKT